MRDSLHVFSGNIARPTLFLGTIYLAPRDAGCRAAARTPVVPRYSFPSLYCTFMNIVDCKRALLASTERTSSFETWIGGSSVPWSAAVRLP